MTMFYSETWTLLEAEARYNSVPGILKRRIDHPHINMFLGVKTKSNKRVFLLGVPKNSLKELDDFPHSKGFEVKRSKFVDENDQVFMELILTSDSFLDIFSTLVEDVVEHLKSYSREIDLVGIFQSRIIRWQRFLDRHKPDGLGVESQRGLFGELIFLREYGFRHRGVSSAVAAWTGPQRTVHDFQFPKCSVEVKTSTAKQHQKLKITSERQLDNSHVEALFVFHLSLSTQFSNGETLVELVQSVRSLLRFDYRSLTLFEDALFEYGYLDTHADRYVKHRYSIRESNVFKVQEGFPRIIERDVPNGVGDLQYSVLVSECKHYSIPDSDLILFVKR